MLREEYLAFPAAIELNQGQALLIKLSPDYTPDSLRCLVTK